MGTDGSYRQNDGQRGKPHDYKSYYAVHEYRGKKKLAFYRLKVRRNLFAFVEYIGKIISH